MKPTIKPIRCAIYTRKSTEEGLDKEFNTLDAQRESGEAFITSQKSQGWSYWLRTTMTAASRVGTPSALA
jgi:DNA invertase Pin-like site-specific DNA recombinase